jgi:hypothetical protein
MVDVDVVVGDAGAAKRVDLVVGVLVSGRDARVSEEHGVENTGRAGISVVVSRRGFSTPDSVGTWRAGRVSANECFSSPGGWAAAPGPWWPR